MARDFPGTAGNYLSIGDVAAIDITGTALTLAAWVFADIATPDQSLINKRGVSGGYQYQLGIDSSGKPFVLIGDGATSFDIATGATSVGTTGWKHLVGRKNGTGASALAVFLDGTSDGTATSNLSIGNSTQGLVFGRHSDSDTALLNGRLAEVGIWSVALTDAEIVSLARGFSPLLVRPQSLAGYWQLIGRSSPEQDRRNGNNATITGTVNAADHARVFLPSIAIAS